MTNQIDLRAHELAAKLARNRLTKTAGDQTISNTTPEDQNSLGAEQTKEIKDNIEGTLAFTDAAANKPSDKVEELPNCQSLNQPAEQALAATGTQVDTMDQTGEPAAMPKAASYKRQLATVLHQLDKQASMKKQAAEFQENFRTGTEVMNKIASLPENPTQEQYDECRDELCKLAATNPMFNVCRDRILQTKLAADVAALAEAEGISPEEAAAAMDQAAEADPSIVADAEDEANGEAVAELADAEASANDMMEGLQMLADNASAATGTEVTPEQIMDAIDEVEAQAAELGVPPEALVEAAMEQVNAESEVTPEDEANAEAIMQTAAELGVSPEEVLQMATEELASGEGEAAPAEAPAEEPAEAPAEGEKKTASANTAATPRAAYVQQLLHRG